MKVTTLNKVPKTNKWNSLLIVYFNSNTHVTFLTVQQISANRLLLCSYSHTVCQLAKCTFVVLPRERKGYEITSLRDGEWCKKHRTVEEEEGLFLKVRTARWDPFNCKFKAHLNFFFFLIDRCRVDRQIDDLLLLLLYTALHSWRRCVQIYTS